MVIPLKGMLTSKSLRTVNVTSFEKRIFASVIKDHEIILDYLRGP